LDYPSRVELLDLALAINRGEMTLASEPLTILFITQFPEETLFAKRLLVFDHGRIEFDGPPTAIFQRIEALRAVGLRPPEEFSLWQKVQTLQSQTGKVTFSSIEDLILNPIL
jgi:ABC-type multidrug transport system ATPase subunit